LKIHLNYIFQNLFEGKHIVSFLFNEKRKVALHQVIGPKGKWPELLDDLLCPVFMGLKKRFQLYFFNDYSMLQLQVFPEGKTGHFVHQGPPA